MILINNYLLASQLGQLSLIMFLISLAWSQHIMSPIDCRLAPPGLFEICEQLRRFDIAARTAFAIATRQPRIFISAPMIPHTEHLVPAVPPEPSFIPSVYDCLDLECLCPYFAGGLTPNGTCYLSDDQILKRAVRKEIRMLSDEERERFFNAMRQLKASGEYDYFARIHRQEASESGAHSGPAFLLWHREFAKRMEIALRSIDPDVALPYWDSTLDQHLPDPRGSIMWSSILMGESDLDGQVINGPFAGFTTLEGHPTITRHLGEEGRLFTEQNINNVYNASSIEGILAYTAPTRDCPYPPNFSALEYYHASVHIWIGGDMKPPVTSANDPVFYLHHSFVDLIFENWRQMHQTRRQREQEYPEEILSCTTPFHFADAHMRPFNLLNRDGLSNAYTDHMYTYEPRPNCSRSEPSCRSKFLFCDLLHGPPHCVSKLKFGERCEHFVDEDACYMGNCSDGYCRPNSANLHRTSASVMPTLRHQIPDLINQLITTTRSAERACLNDDPCCSIWARSGECHHSVPYMRMYCRRSCHYCQSTDNRQNGCFNRHISCSYMQQQGECIRRRQWMSENCQAACGWCNISAHDLCVRTALISRMK